MHEIMPVWNPIPCIEHCLSHSLTLHVLACGGSFLDLILKKKASRNAVQLLYCNPEICTSSAFDVGLELTVAAVEYENSKLVS